MKIKTLYFFCNKYIDAIMRKEYLRLAEKLNKVCLNMNSRQNGIYSPKIQLHNKKTVEEITKDINKMISFLNAPHYSYMSKIKK